MTAHQHGLPVECIGLDGARSGQLLHHSESLACTTPSASQQALRPAMLACSNMLDTTHAKALRLHQGPQSQAAPGLA